MAVVQSPFTMTLSTQKYNQVIQHQQHSPQQVILHHPMAHQATNPKTVVIQNKRPLAPAPEPRSSVLVANNNSSSSSVSSGDLRCKRKIQFMPYGQPQQQPASVARRNARERNRVKQVNNGFATLRQHIPPSVAQAFAPQGPAAVPAATGRGASKKLSKVETLRLAVEYIRSLKQMIDEHENPDLANSSGESSLHQDSQRFYTGSPEQYSYTTILTCSEASASPTPSHSSEGSFSAASGYTNTIYHHHQENFENYEPKSPEDEELLDAIFSWQQNE